MSSRYGLRGVVGIKGNGVIAMTYHVLPTNDLKEHTEDTTCECKPRVIFENGEMIVVHNSFDGREHVEKLLNPNKN